MRSLPEPFSPERFERFHEKIKLADPPTHLQHLGPCWLWIAYIDKSGYGRFYCPGFPAINGDPKGSEMILAHRWPMAFWYGVTKLHKLTHDHQCCRKACTSPRHGFAITRAENTARGNVLRHVYQPEDPFEALGI
jgi:hypothetical protein